MSDYDYGLTPYAAAAAAAKAVGLLSCLLAWDMIPEPFTARAREIVDEFDRGLMGKDEREIEHMGG